VKDRLSKTHVRRERKRDKASGGFIIGKRKRSENKEEVSSKEEGVIVSELTMNGEKIDIVSVYREQVIKIWI